MSTLTETQRRDALILASQGDTPEAIAGHLLVEVADLPASMRRRARKPADEQLADEQLADEQLADEQPADE